MKKINNIDKTGKSLVVLLFCVLWLFPVKANIVNPDFSFPATVRKDALPVYEQALKEKNGLTALLCANELTLSDRLISSDSLVNSIARYREISRRCPLPYSLLSELMEAKILSDVYNSQRYVFNQRELSNDQLNEEPMLWSGAQMRSEISSLLGNVLDNIGDLRNFPLSDISLLITSGKNKDFKDLTCADFALTQILSIASSAGLNSNIGNSPSIPFKIVGAEGKVITENKSDNYSSRFTPSDILNKLIEINSNKDNDSYALFTARVLKLYYNVEPLKEYALELLKLYPQGSRLRPELVALIFEQGSLNDEIEEGMKECYSLLTSTIEAYPDSEFVGCLKNRLSELLRPSMNFSFSGQWLSNEKNQIIVKSRNLKDTHILIVPLSTAQAEATNLRVVNIKPAGKIIDVGVITTDKPAPFVLNDTITVEGLPAGYYAVLGSTNSSLSGLYSNLKNQNPDILNVSDISMFIDSDFSNFSAPASQKKSLQTPSVYIVDARNCQPISGAKVTFKEMGKSASSKILTTDKSGAVRAPFARADVKIQYGNSHLQQYVYSYGDYPYIQGRFVAEILPDLAIYHPGDTVRCLTVAGKVRNNTLSPADSLKVKLLFKDANYKTINEKELITQNMGRATTSFVIPEECLTGVFQIETWRENNLIGSTSIRVEDYKSPTFFVSLEMPEIDNTLIQNRGEDSQESDSHPADLIRLRGKVMTYSGMPLSDTPVTIDITFSNRYRYWLSSYPATHYGATVQTDKEGNFTLRLSTVGLADKGYNQGVFRAVASAVSSAGESRVSESRSFTIGEGYTLSAYMPAKMEIASDDVEFNVAVRDLSGKPVNKNIKYEIKNLNHSEFILSGEFMSPVLSINASSLPSGEYSYRFILPDALNLSASTDNKSRCVADTIKGKIILWREDDKVPPVSSAVWVPAERIYAQKGVKTVPVKIGNSYKDGKIFCQISDSASVISKLWLTPGGKMTVLEVPAPEKGNRIKVSYFAVHNLNAVKGDLYIEPYASDKKPEWKVVTFRDKVSPGNTENWKFRISIPGLEQEKFAVAAVMSNKALNAITPFSWDFNPARILSNYTVGRISFNPSGSNWVSFNSNVNYIKNAQCPQITLPDWNLWGQSFLINSRKIYVRGLKKESRAVTAATSEAIVEDMANEMAAFNSSPEMLATGKSTQAVLSGAVKDEIAEAETDEGEADPEVELRPVEYPLAFFKPDLSTNDEGMVNIDFLVPNFNTTWVLQLLGYDHNLKSCKGDYEIVAAKPIMVSVNSPSFLRTGDKAEISSMIFNNSNDKLDIHAKIEIIDPLSGAVLGFTEETFRDVEPAANRTQSIDWNVPDNLSSVIIRVIADSERGSDGEQTEILILPSTAPVNNAYTFYTDATNNSAVVSIPKLNKDALVTLNYCANPQWYVLTELSGLLQPSSESALVVADALFANSTSYGMVNANTDIKNVLEKLIEDNSDETLLSPLYQQSSLKLKSLQITPWINNAENENVRMAGLADYLNTGKCESAINMMITKLTELQNPSGGWSWMKQMPESEYITLRVLSKMGELNYIGYLPNNQKLISLLSKGLEYSDIKIERDYNKWISEVKKPYPLSQELSYIYMRELLTSDRFADKRGNKDFIKIGVKKSGVRKIKEDLLKRLPSEWKKLSLKDKINAAVILELNGNHNLAQTIINSVKEFASYKPQKGMWFDTVEETMGNGSSLLLTSSCIKAMRLISPEDKDIEKMMQYVILSRQTQDWNLSISGSSVAAVASAILSDKLFYDANSVSFSTTTLPEIYVGEELIDINSNRSNLAGNYYINLSPEKISGKDIRIVNHNGNISWGGIVCQYIDKIENIKAHSVSQLKITKTLLPVEINADGMTVGRPTDKFKKGDKINVTLTVVNDRKIDYVLIQDTSGAFMQPTEQLTQYAVIDGIWMLKQPSTSSTNFYITSLPKGKHVISYQVSAARDGEYSTGIANAQSLYYPIITSHSAGMTVKVE